MGLDTLFNDIVDAIHEKDGLSDCIYPACFPQRIRDITTGSNAFPDITYDPKETYRLTRPSDWLPMPVPDLSSSTNSVIYALFLVPENGSALVSVRINCTGSFTMEFGTVENERFVSFGSIQKAGGTALSARIYDDTRYKKTSDGMKQVMLRFSAWNMRHWVTTTHPDYISGFADWNIVDMRCRLESGDNVFPSGQRDAPLMCLRRLRYFSWEGPNDLDDGMHMFQNCHSLIAVTNLDTQRLTNIPQFFENCYSLISIPNLDLRSATNCREMFQSCYSMKHIPDLNIRNVTNLQSAFKDCISLLKAPQINYSKATNLNGIFSGCTSLMSVQDMNVAVATDMTDAFKDTTCLSELTFDPSITGWSGCAIDLTSSKIYDDKLNKLIESLPSIKTYNQLRLIGVPYISSLTEDMIQKAKDKNWNLLK